MEYLDYYDEEGHYLGYKTREEVHEEGLWHNTIHCWLYDKEGNIYFQIRTDSHKFYTTASGHVKQGETIKEAFKREIKEEIGIDVDTSDSILVGIIPWKMDKTKKDGTIIKDRAKANVYINEYIGNADDFNFDPNEVEGIGKFNAKETLKLLKEEKGTIKGTIISKKEDKITIKNTQVSFDEFLVMPHETAITKYGDILKKVIEITK